MSNFLTKEYDYILYPKLDKKSLDQPSGGGRSLFCKKGYLKTKVGNTCGVPARSIGVVPTNKMVDMVKQKSKER